MLLLPILFLWLLSGVGLVLDILTTSLYHTHTLSLLAVCKRCRKKAVKMITDNPPGQIQQVAEEEL